MNALVINCSPVRTSTTAELLFAEGKTGIDRIQ
jgi:hypothetical protein